MCAVVLKFLSALLLRKSHLKFWLASVKTLTNSKNHFSNPLKRAWSGTVYKKPSVTSNSSESCLWHVNLRGFFLHPMGGVQYTGENWPMTEKGSFLLILCPKKCTVLTLFANYEAKRARTQKTEKKFFTNVSHINFACILICIYSTAPPTWIVFPGPTGCKYIQGYLRVRYMLISRPTSM